MFLPAIFTYWAYGQELKPNSIIKGNKISLKVDDIKTPGADFSSDRVYVANVNNIYHGRKPKISAWDISLYQKMEKGSMLKAFGQVFNDTRLKELASTDRGLAIFLYITPSGKVTEVGFLIRKNTALTTLEIEQLENALKTDVTFKIQPKETKDGDFFIINMEVKYKNILDKEEFL